jgi:hypothetical protein
MRFDGNTGRLGQAARAFHYDLGDSNAGDGKSLVSQKNRFLPLAHGQFKNATSG